MTQLQLPRSIATLAAILVALLPCAAAAQWVKPGDETALVRLGAVSQRLDTTARLDGSTNGGTTIDLERDAGISDDKTSLILQAALRVAPRHRIDGLYTETSRSASRATPREVVIGNVTVPAGSVLTTDQKTAIGYLGYRYSVVKSQGVEIAAGVGAYGGQLKASFAANSPVVNASQSTTVPLPVLVFSADAYLSERLILTGTLRGLKVEVNDLDGRVLAIGAGAEYLVSSNIGVGLAVERFSVAVDARKPSFDGRLQVDSTAGRLYLVARF